MRRTIILLSLGCLLQASIAAAGGRLDAGSQFDDEQRQWWAIQPVRRPQPPTVEQDDWSRGPIDRFVLRRLGQAGLAPAAEADRRTLARRLAFDLTGLPPTPAEVAEFLNDRDPGAYERLVDRLLASPAYGEHWARYWLDLVRYAESDGYRADAYRSEAYRYRDYVIAAFNDDKPYDRFVAEQLAGDEIYPGDRDAAVATMFYRHGIYEYNNRDVEGQWQGMLDEITDVTAEVFLGLGLRCARCHDHKFDPLLQSDYYRLKAFFTPLDFREDRPLAAADERQEYVDQLARWNAATETLRRELRELEYPVLLAEAGGEGFEKFTPEIKTLILRWPEDRDPYERQIASLACRQFTVDRKLLPEKLPPETRDRWEELRRELKEHASLKPAPLPEQSFVVSDVGPIAPPTRIPGDDAAVAPGVPTILDPHPVSVDPLPPVLATTGRRRALARWIVSPENPLTSRVIVNRLWEGHFGRGLTVNANDFGQLGEPPTHPELLDWLASELVESGWRLKPIHRQIVTSAAYRQASTVARDHAGWNVDPANKLFWRQNPRRLRAEPIRDALLATTGELDRRRGGPSEESDSLRRSIYQKVRRNAIDPLLAAFDVADGQNCIARRDVTTTPTQALLTTNSPWMQCRAAAFARRLADLPHETPQDIAAAAYEIAFARPASEAELTEAADFLNQPQVGEAELLIDFCHVLLSTNELIYID